MRDSRPATVVPLKKSIPSTPPPESPEPATEPVSPTDSRAESIAAIDTAIASEVEAMLDGKASTDEVIDAIASKYGPEEPLHNSSATNAAVAVKETAVAHVAETTDAAAQPQRVNEPALVESPPTPPLPTPAPADSPKTVTPARIRPAVIAISLLAWMNLPFLWIPSQWRPALDWFALSLVFWVPITWAFALMLTI